jgi:hypothetical protein
VRGLVACEFPGTVRDAFAAHGHDAWSCDLLPTERPGKHITGDVLAVLNGGWDLMIAHPPCTHLAVSGSRWFNENLPTVTSNLASLNGVSGRFSELKAAGLIRQLSEERDKCGVWVLN